MFRPEQVLISCCRLSRWTRGLLSSSFLRRVLNPLGHPLWKNWPGLAECLRAKCLTLDISLPKSGLPFLWEAQGASGSPIPPNTVILSSESSEMASRFTRNKRVMAYKMLGYLAPTACLNSCPSSSPTLPPALLFWSLQGICFLEQSCPDFCSIWSSPLQDWLNNFL